MKTGVLAALAAAAAMASAGQASATVMVGRAQGGVTGLFDVGPFAPDVHLGDAVTIAFSYDTDLCVTMGGSPNCYGGGVAQAPTVATATLTINGWSETIPGLEWDVLSPGSYDISPKDEEVIWFHLLASTPADDLATPISGAAGYGLYDARYADPQFEAQYDIDSFYVHAAGVPEPTGWATMILGLFGLGAMLRRRPSLGVAA